MIYSPLEQFKIFNYFIFSNYCISIIFLILFIYILINKINFLIPCFIFQKMETIFWVFFELCKSNIKKFYKFFFLLIFLIFFFFLISNLLGMLPYSFTITSQVLLIFFISLFLFLTMNISSLCKHGIKFFKLFLPSSSNLNFFLILLLIPIEIISYVFRLISLPVRLFSNIMAGHILIKIIISFLIVFFNFNFLISILSTLPIVLLIICLIFLETAIAFIQAYVFVVLLSVYLNDAFNLHH